MNQYLRHRLYMGYKGLMVPVPKILSSGKTAQTAAGSYGVYSSCQKGDCLEYFLMMLSNKIQVVANLMAADHTRGVRLETGKAFDCSPYLCETDDIRLIKNNILTVLFKKHPSFSLHSRKTSDIKPIVKTTVPAPGPRPCSTTFYV